MPALTFSNLNTRIMNRLRIPTGNSTEAAKIDALTNDVIREICSKYDFPWLAKRQVLNTVDDITTGTIDVTKGSASATLSAAQATSLTDRIIFVTSNAVENASYRISAHTANATAVTLGSNYNGATNTAAAYVVYQDEYDLAADVGKALYVRRFGYPLPLRKVGWADMLGLKNYDTTEGPPQLWAVHDYDTTGDNTTQKQLIVHPYPDDTYQMEVHYKLQINSTTEVSGSTVIPIPQDYLHVLEWGILGYAYPIFLSDTVRGSYYLGRYGDALNLMVAQHRDEDGGSPVMQMADTYRSHFRRGRRLSPATADLGTWFGRWPFNP
jgi:hypothetical protein